MQEPHTSYLFDTDLKERSKQFLWSRIWTTGLLIVDYIIELVVKLEDAVAM